MSNSFKFKISQKILKISFKSFSFLQNLDEFSSEFHEDVEKMLKFVEMYAKIAISCENSGKFK